MTQERLQKCLMFDSTSSPVTSLRQKGAHLTCALSHNANSIGMKALHRKAHAEQHDRMVHNVSHQSIHHPFFVLVDQLVSW